MKTYAISFQIDIEKIMQLSKVFYFIKYMMKNGFSSLYLFIVIETLDHEYL